MLKPSAFSRHATVPQGNQQTIGNTGVDFAGPIAFKITKEQGKCYILLFTCPSSRVVHLELTRTQMFIARRTRPKVIISDNASVFKSTATWMKNNRKSKRLHDYQARQDKLAIQPIQIPLVGGHV